MYQYIDKDGDGIMQWTPLYKISTRQIFPDEQTITKSVRYQVHKDRTSQSDPSDKLPAINFEDGTFGVKDQSLDDTQIRPRRSGKPNVRVSPNPSPDSAAGRRAGWEIEGALRVDDSAAPSSWRTVDANGSVGVTPSEITEDGWSRTRARPRAYLSNKDFDAEIERKPFSLQTLGLGTTIPMLRSTETPNWGGAVGIKDGTGATITDYVKRIIGDGGITVTDNIGTDGGNTVTLEVRGMVTNIGSDNGTISVGTNINGTVIIDVANPFVEPVDDGALNVRIVNPGAETGEWSSIDPLEKYSEGGLEIKKVIACTQSQFTMWLDDGSVNNDTIYFTRAD